MDFFMSDNDVKIAIFVVLATFDALFLGNPK